VRRRSPAVVDLWKELRRRMLEETSQFLTECLEHPELAVVIPTIPAGKGGFPAIWAEHFWNNVLYDN